jgi:hypothetical protein
MKSIRRQDGACVGFRESKQGQEIFNYASATDQNEGDRKTRFFHDYFIWKCVAT